ncbi:MAG TPA: sodium/proline symporter, partial [Bacteroidetes bacterium]|nr:sodium/proline symporter [Bacteroidota bacterium]
MEGAGNVALRVDLWAFGAFAFYLMVMVVIGVVAARFSSAGLDEYFLAGRKLRSFVVALSAVASGRSSWLLLGVTGMAYVRGVGAVWAVVGYILVELFLFAFVGRRLRRLTGASGDITVPDFLESRFEDRSGLLRVVAVTVILIFMVTYVAAQFTAGGKTFAASFGISSFEGVVITATIVLIYTLLGGFLAVSLTDLLQAIFMITFLVLIPVVAFSKFGGWTAVFSTLHGLDPRLLDPF